MICFIKQILFPSFSAETYRTVISVLRQNCLRNVLNITLIIKITPDLIFVYYFLRTLTEIVIGENSDQNSVTD